MTYTVSGGALNSTQSNPVYLSHSEYTFRRQLKMWLFKKSFQDIITWYWLHFDF